MPPDASGASPSISDPLPAASGFNATAMLRKYWWEIGIVILVIAFLVYTYMKNSSSAQVGTASTTAAIDPATGLPVASGDSTGTTSAMFGQLQTEFTTLQNMITAEGAADKPPAPAPAPKPGPKPAPKPGPKWYGPKSGFAEHVKEYAKAHPGAPAPVYGGTTAPKGGAALGHGGPPASGPAVPFGTHVGLHNPLAASGDMYASARS